MQATQHQPSLFPTQHPKWDRLNMRETCQNVLPKLKKSAYENTFRKDGRKGLVSDAHLNLMRVLVSLLGSEMGRMQAERPDVYALLMSRHNTEQPLKMTDKRFCSAVVQDGKKTVQTRALPVITNRGQISDMVDCVEATVTNRIARLFEIGFIIKIEHGSHYHNGIKLRYIKYWINCDFLAISEPIAAKNENSKSPVNKGFEEGKNKTLSHSYNKEFTSKELKNNQKRFDFPEKNDISVSTETEKPIFLAGKSERKAEELGSSKEEFDGAVLSAVGRAEMDELPAPIPKKEKSCAKKESFVRPATIISDNLLQHFCKIFYGDDFYANLSENRYYRLLLQLQFAWLGDGTLNDAQMNERASNLKRAFELMERYIRNKEAKKYAPETYLDTAPSRNGKAILMNALDWVEKEKVWLKQNAAKLRAKLNGTFQKDTPKPKYKANHPNFVYQDDPNRTSDL